MTSALDRSVAAYRAAKAMGPAWKRALIAEIDRDNLRKAREGRDQRVAAAKTDRAVELVEARETCAEERKAVTEHCAARRESVRERARRRVEEAKQLAREALAFDRAEKAQQRRLKKEQAARRGPMASITESNDEVASNVEAWEPTLVPVWRRMQSSSLFKGTPHHRFEAFQQYVHDQGGPSAFVEAEGPTDLELLRDQLRNCRNEDDPDACREFYRDRYGITED